MARQGQRAERVRVTLKFRGRIVFDADVPTPAEADGFGPRVFAAQELRAALDKLLSSTLSAAIESVAAEFSSDVLQLELAAWRAL